LTTVLALAACSGGNGTPAARATSLLADPPAFAPGDTVLLRPFFPDGTARIDPDIGPVQSGGSYRVGPATAARRYTLTVTRTTGVEVAAVDVPVRYRERVRELPPSPIVRTRHGATVLADGRVLLVGGASVTPLFWATAEIFDPATGAFTPVGDLAAGRSDSAVVALPDGSAVTVGGPINSPSFDVATRVERWDPSGGAWSPLGNTLSNRSSHTATLVDAARILVVGGVATGGAADERDAEIFELGVGARSPAGPMRRNRAGHTATRLADGSVWIAGGGDTASGELIADTETFVPATETFLPAAGLALPRVRHHAVALDDGSVLVVGGDGVGGPVATAERYDPQSGGIAAAGNLGVPRYSAPAVRLLDGRVIAVGGVPATALATDSIEVWDPATGTWRPWGSRLPVPRNGHSLHVLADGRVVVFGGDPGDGFPVAGCYVID
jgi:hypothetical protein